MALGGVALMLGVSACGGGSSATPEDNVRAFAKDFAAKVQEGNADSIKALYADGTSADSLVKGLVNDSITVYAQAGAEGTYLVKYGNRAQITVVTAAAGTTSGKNGTGGFAYAPERMAAARKFGQYSDSLNDVENARRMADTAFVSELVPGFVNDFKRGVKATLGKTSINEDSFICTADIVVENNTGTNLDGSEYAVLFTTDEPMGYIAISPNSGGPRTRNGVPVKAGQKAHIIYKAYDIIFLEVSDLRLEWKATDRELFDKYYKATGHEYDDRHALR